MVKQWILLLPPAAHELSEAAPPSVAWIGKIKAMQDSGLDASLFLFGTVGCYHPLRAFAKFDEKCLLNFISVGNQRDLPRLDDAPRQLHLEWRQRSLAELHLYKQLSTPEYHEALITLRTLGRDVADDPDIVAIFAACADEQVPYIDTVPDGDRATLPLGDLEETLGRNQS